MRYRRVAGGDSPVGPRTVRLLRLADPASRGAPHGSSVVYGLCAGLLSACAALSAGLPTHSVAAHRDACGLGAIPLLICGGFRGGAFSCRMSCSADSPG